MKYDRFTIALLLMTAMFLGGCGAFVSKNSPVKREISSAERNFAAALQFMRIGSETGAREQLERVVDDSALNGVTDEALFLLAVLILREENGRGETRARKLLYRLISEFPDSNWSRQAAPLLVYIQETANLRARMRELKSLRDRNLSLSRDNKGLRQSIERLRDFDLELEQKIRR